MADAAASACKVIKITHGWRRRFTPTQIEDGKNRAFALA